MSTLHLFPRRLPGVILALVLLFSVGAQAGGVYDVGGDAAIVLPDVIDASNSPVYITASAAPDDGGGEIAPASAAGLTSFTVREQATLHIGYSDTAVAADDIALSVFGNMDVNGTVLLGKETSLNMPGLPDAATSTSLGIAVGRTLGVGAGGHIILTGANDGVAGVDAVHSVISAENVVLDGGAVTLERFSRLEAGRTLAGAPAVIGGPAVVIRNGGVMTLNSGLPDIITADGPAPEPAVPAPAARPRVWQNADESAWVFKGLDVSGGGTGILVDNGGVLAAGRNGGAIIGVAGQTLTVARGGLLDADSAGLLVGGIDSVVIAGAYRAGLASHLTVDGGGVSFAAGGTLLLSRDLQRAINAGSILATDAVLLEAGQGVVFADGTLPTLSSAMGRYTLASATDADGNTVVSVATVANGVVGDASESDRQRFQDNIGDVWTPGSVNRAQSDIIYNLTASRTPTVDSYGPAGDVNRAVLEALAEGRGQAVAGYGVADQGVFEMYNGAAQWGVNTAARNVAGEFMAGLDRRVTRVGAEMDRLGEGWLAETAVEETAVSETALPSLASAYNDSFERRFWVGGFGREERADLDYGISGYTYRPRGIMAGYDKMLGQFSLGVAAAYAKGDYRDQAAESGASAITSYSAGVYGSYHGLSGLNASAYAAISHLDNDIEDYRGGMRRDADHTGYSWSAGARVGYDKLLSDRLTVSPSAGISKIQTIGRAHDEYLGGVGVLRVGEVRGDATLVPVDVTVSYDLVRNEGAILRLTGNLGYAYDLENAAPAGTFVYDGLTGTTPVGIAARDSGRHRFMAGAGMLYTSPRFDISARYDYLRRNKETAHEAKGAVGVKF